MVAMRRELGLRAVTFPQCALGGDFQKWTTLWYSNGLRGQLDGLSVCACQHQGHRDIARGRGQRGEWHSAEAAAYPTRMNEIIASAVKDAVDAQERGGVSFRHHVRAWFSVGPGERVLTGYMDPRRGLRGDDDESGITGTEQVHVWERHELASCAEELQVWERRDEMAENVRMWCSGPVVDWDLVAEASGFV